MPRPAGSARRPRRRGQLRDELRSGHRVAALAAEVGGRDEPTEAAPSGAGVEAGAATSGEDGDPGQPWVDDRSTADRSASGPGVGRSAEGGPRWGPAAAPRGGPGGGGRQRRPPCRRLPPGGRVVRARAGSPRPPCVRTLRRDPDGEVDAEDRVDARLGARLDEPDRPVEPVAVGQGERRLPPRHRPLDEGGGGRGAVLHRVPRRHMEVDEGLARAQPGLRSRPCRSRRSSMGRRSSTDRWDRWGCRSGTGRRCRSIGFVTSHDRTPPPSSVPTRTPARRSGRSGPGPCPAAGRAGPGRSPGSSPPAAAGRRTPVR